MLDHPAPRDMLCSMFMLHLDGYLDMRLLLHSGSILPNWGMHRAMLLRQMLGHSGYNFGAMLCRLFQLQRAPTEEEGERYFS